MAWLIDPLFIFAVIAGAIYELIYEPVCALVKRGMRLIITVAPKAWTDAAGEAENSTSGAT